MDNLVELIQKNAEGKDLSILGGTVKLVVDDQTVLVTPEGEVSSSDEEADCTMTIDSETMQSIMNGETSGQAAFMTGKLKVTGDMGIALKTQSFLGN